MELKRTITFNEAAHSYTDEFGIKYTSVTTLIGKYEEPFNEDYWAGQKAKELNLTKQQVLDNWKQIRDYANAKGTKTHNILEDSINEATGKADLNIEAPSFKTYYKQLNIKENCEVDIKLLGNSPLAIKYPEIFLYLLEHVEQGWRIFAEKRVYWADYAVAGTIDCLLVKGKQFKIVDWKTNKDELQFTSGYYKKVNGVKTTLWIPKDERMKSPISNIQKCKGNGYTLQLSLYAFLMELWGFQCVGLILYHIRDNDKPKPYNIAYWQSDCQKLLIDNKNRSTKTDTSINTMSFGIK